MSQLGVALQESLRTQREARSTILGLLREQMDGVDGGTRRRRSLKERFGFIGMGCCGASWGFRSDALSVNQGEQEQQQETDPGRVAAPECVGPAGSVRAPRVTWRVSLMRLLEETEGGDAATAEKEKEKEENVLGNDSVCCVCMGRKKGAALIPCGHTFCRVCSRELWLNRGSCPLCNRSILEILDIF
ncbi:hypothetical protein glysoja_009977 [Glycine soja]|nr:hypothetical protein glysoja_009977 [Glycine soja]